MISSISRPPMNRAVGTGWPNALTFTSTSRFASNSTARPPKAITIIQVPVDSTPQGASARCGTSEALESWIPHRTGAPTANPVASATSGSTGPSTSAALRTGGNNPSQPIRPTKDENCPAHGFHRSVWQPSDVASLAATPDNRNDQYCASISTWRTRANSAGCARDSQNTCAPTFSPTGRRGDPVSANPGRTAPYAAASVSGPSCS